MPKKYIDEMDELDEYLRIMEELNPERPQAPVPELYGYGETGQYGIKHGEKDYRYTPETNKFSEEVPSMGSARVEDIDPSLFYLQGKEGKRTTPYKEDWELERELDEEQRMAAPSPVKGMTTQGPPDIYKEARALVQQRAPGLWAHTFPGKAYGSRLNKEEASWWRNNLSRLQQNSLGEVKEKHKGYKTPEERAEKQKRNRLLDFQIKSAEKGEKDLARIAAEAEARAEGTARVKTAKPELTERQALKEIDSINRAIDRYETTGNFDLNEFASFVQVFGKKGKEALSKLNPQEAIDRLKAHKQYILDKFVSEDTKKTYGYGGKSAQGAPDWRKYRK